MHIAQQPASPETIARGHEGVGVSLKGYSWFLVVMVVTLVFVQILVWGLMVGFQKFNPSPVEATRQVSPLISQRTTFPQPWLQPSKAQPKPHMPWQDMAAFRAHEDQILTNVGPSEVSQDKARIPIDRAMQMIVDKGFPTEAGEKKL